jgi:polyhydroxyalkanoate synthesis regulator protein
MPAARQSQPTLVKRYAGSRLYDTTHRCYVVPAQLRGWFADGIEFVVIDSATGADITRSVLVS